MAIVGIKSLRFAAEDVAITKRFFSDFGLPLVESDPDRALFALAEGSTVEVLPMGHASLPSGEIKGPGAHEIIWGVDSREALMDLVNDLRRDHTVTEGSDGAFHFIPFFGIPMALAYWQRKKVVYSPDPSNAPDRVVRLNTHRKWRNRAIPKVLNHVVHAIPDYEAGTAFMRERLGFRLSDVQDTFGIYLRADGSNNHHSILLLNANAKLPDCDGSARFHHANFGVEDLDELMIGVNNMERCGWEMSDIGLGRHRVDSGLFYYLPFPGGGEIEYGADQDYIDDSWVPRLFTVPLFGYAHFTAKVPPFIKEPPEWTFKYLTSECAPRRG